MACANKKAVAKYLNTSPHLSPTGRHALIDNAHLYLLGNGSHAALVGAVVCLCAASLISQVVDLCLVADLQAQEGFQTESTAALFQLQQAGQGICTNKVR